MDERNDDPTSDDATTNGGLAGKLSRRRWLQLAGVGIVGGAAAGTVGADASDHPNTIVFDGTVSSGMSTYRFEVSESVEPDGDVGAVEVDDAIDGSSVEGTVHRDVDAYRFSGDLTFLNVDGEAAVSVDYGEGSDVGADRLQVVASGSDSVDYAFTAAGRIEPVRDHADYPADDEDAVAENGDGTWTASGRTGGSGDTYDFWGGVESFEPPSGEFALFLNGEEVTPYELTGQRRTRRLAVVAEDLVRYAFTASGEIEKVLDAGDRSAEQNNDAVVDNGDGTWTVEGFTGNGYGDAYDFAGEATGFDVLEGECTLYLDGEEVTIAELTGEESPNDGPEPDHRLEIVNPASSWDEYSFTTTGEMTKVLDNGDNSAEEDNDAVVDNGDGTCTAEGVTGDGYGDTYDFVGEVTAFEPMEGPFELSLDGEPITTYELVGEDRPTHTLEIVRREDDYIDYAFTATGEIAKDLDNGDRSAEEDNDAVVENGDGTWTVEGVTGDGYGDTFDVFGEITDFDPKDGQFALYLDGERLTAYELVGEEPPDDGGSSGGSSTPVDGGPIGGGDGYPNTVSPDEADVTVSTKDGLLDALSSAGSGDVVYVAGNASIDMGSTDFQVPAGVTLASNRGIDGAPGGHLHTDEETRSIHVARNGRVTGLRIQGPFYEFFSTSDWVGGVGVRATEPGIEIDNNEIWGWAYAAINGLRNDEHVHHNHLHHNPRDGVGYGVECHDGHPLIEWNYFNANRHGIAASGNGGYTVRYCRFGPDTIDAPIDCHRPGGERIEVYRNTVEGYEDAWSSREWPAVSIRGVPDDVCTVYDNWFHNPKEPRSSPNMWTDEAIIQVHVDEWTNMEWENNHYGESEPSTDIGHPR